MKYVMGIDLGTTGCKACLLDENGTSVSSNRREYACYYPQPGYVEQDIIEIKESMFASCRQTIEESGINPTNIAGISLSTQPTVMILLDENENALSDRFISWLDIRHIDIQNEMRSIISEDEHYELAGFPFGALNIAILNWLQKHEPETWKKVFRICSLQDYFLRLFGADGFYTDEISANNICMLNVNTLEWEPRLMQIYNVNRSQLSTIVRNPGKVVGRVTKDISAQTMLPVDCSLCLGGTDVYCSVLGAGTSKNGVNALVVGTSGVSVLIADSPVKDPDKRIVVRSNPGFGNYQLLAVSYTAASAFRWFRNEFCTTEVAAGNLIGSDPYDLMTAMAQRSKPGSGGVTALTCLQGSNTAKRNEKIRGTFLGISLETTKADFTRAILEGVVFEIHDMLQMKERVAPINMIRLCGGVSKSPFWCQMFADILHKPIEVVKEAELGGLGAAICAGVGAGLFKDLDDAIEKCVHIEKVYHPNKENQEAYKEAYARWSEAFELLGNSYYK
jgi:xylulokinase